jgi:hypothetical protein
MNTPNKRIRSGRRVAAKNKCNCDYCEDNNIPYDDREMVPDGIQCAIGWRMELTGKPNRSSEIGRAEFLDLGSNY